MLPDYSIVHKQDFFIKENYQPDTERDELSFLSRSFERHFNERPFLNHYCGTILPRHRVEKSLCRRLLSLVVFVRKRRQSSSKRSGSLKGL